MQKRANRDNKKGIEAYCLYPQFYTYESELADFLDLEEVKKKDLTWILNDSVLDVFFLDDDKRSDRFLALSDLKTRLEPLIKSQTITFRVVVVRLGDAPTGDDLSAD